MTALTPREIMIKQSEGSVAKAEGNLGKLFVLGMMAGAFIALGAQASLMASFNLTSDPATFGIGKVVMGAVFPVGLMMVVLCGAELFTGNCLMIIGTLDKKIRTSQMLRNWAIVYIGNLAGSLIIVLAIAYSGLWDSGAGLLGAMTVKTAAGKCGLSFGRAVVLGIFCNFLVCLAVWMAAGSQETIGKIFAIWFCIGLFIVSGFEHSVANMYFIPAGMLVSSPETAVSLSGFLLNNLLPVTIGNMIGGALFVGAGLYGLYGRKDS